MENNQHTTALNDVQQQINHMKTKTDNLIHKYVTCKMAKYSIEYWSHIAAFVGLVFIGIFLHESIKLAWPVIIVTWIVTLGLSFYSFNNCQPISKSRIAITPTVTLRENLLIYSKNERILAAIQATANLVLSIWWAFEVQSRLYLGHYAYKLNITDIDISKVAFYLILFIGIITTIEAFAGIFAVNKYVNQVVADIDEARA